MAYILPVALLLLTILSLIALLEEVRGRVHKAAQQSGVMEKQKRIDEAYRLRGVLHKMDQDDFYKWVTDIYAERGYRTKVLTIGKERHLLLEKEQVTALVEPRNYVWPVSREMLAVLYHTKKSMGINQLIIISTGGFNIHAREWAQGNSEIELMDETGLFDLCREGALLPTKNDLFPAQTLVS